MKFIDLFCGIGGFRIGFEENGYSCVFSSDFNSKVQETYSMNFGEVPYGDITKIDPEIIPDFDVLLGGFPCQPFSISGKKKGFEDTRGTLFFDICRIIEKKKPKVVVLENVQHLVHHDKKRTFLTIIHTLKDLGYNVNYKVLNSIDFGLPQNRERIFIIGTVNSYFDFEQMDKIKSKPLSEFLDNDNDNDFEYLDKSEYTLLDKKFIRIQKSGLIFVGYRNKNGFKVGIRPNSEHLNRVHRQPNRIYSIEGYHPTLPSQETSGRFFIYLPKEDRVRKLSINECYRIMGFPDTFIKHSNQGEQYKQIGNSVPVNVIKEISKQIIKQGLLENGSKKIDRGDLLSIKYNR
jgi:DNA (cytosine-5)-methyltransferase 1